jgi:hypothetical protein
MAGIVERLTRLKRESTTKGDYNALTDAIIEIRALAEQRDKLREACQMLLRHPSEDDPLGGDLRRLDEALELAEKAIALCHSPPEAKGHCPDCLSADVRIRTVDGVRDAQCQNCGVVVGVSQLKPYRIAPPEAVENRKMTEQELYENSRGCVEFGT